MDEKFDEQALKKFEEEGGVTTQTKEIPDMEYRENAVRAVRLRFAGKGSKAKAVLNLEIKLDQQEMIDAIMSGSLLGIKIMEAMAEQDKTCGLASLTNPDAAKPES